MLRATASRSSCSVSERRSRVRRLIEMGSGRGVVDAATQLICLVAYAGFIVFGGLTFIAGVLYYNSFATSSPSEQPHDSSRIWLTDVLLTVRTRTCSA